MGRSGKCQEVKMLRCNAIQKVCGENLRFFAKITQRGVTDPTSKIILFTG